MRTEEMTLTQQELVDQEQQLVFLVVQQFILEAEVELEKLGEVVLVVLLVVAVAVLEEHKEQLKVEDQEQPIQEAVEVVVNLVLEQVVLV